MLFVLLIVPAAVILAGAIVVVLDRVGVLPRLDGAPSLPSGGFVERVPKGALWGGAALMAAWILAWLVFLVIGLSVLAG